MPRGMLLAVVAEHYGLSLGHCHDVDRPLPHSKNAAHDVLCVVLKQIETMVIVPQEKLAPIVEIRILDVDKRIASVGELKEKLLLHGLKLPRFDLEALVAVGPTKAEELVITHKIGGQKLVDEGDVAIESAHFEDLFLPKTEAQVPILLRLEIITLFPLLAELAAVPALLDVAKQLDPELIGVEAPATRSEHPRRVVRVVDDLTRVQDTLGHKARMPIRGPPLVHDLGLPLSGEVASLLPDDFDAVVLPAFERRVFHEKDEH